jgi:hypothetical protein
MKTLLVRLYPRRWRARYGDEFEAMLEQQPTSVARVADVLLGAVDAHLTANSPERSGWWLRRLPGLTIVAASLVWLVAYAFRQGGFGQDVINVASIFVPLGKVGVGLGVLALPVLWTGGSRWERRVHVAMGVALIVGASAVRALHLSELVAPGLVDYTWAMADSFFVQAICASQLVWAVAMLTRSPLPRLPLISMAVASLVLLVSVSPSIDPTSGLEVVAATVALSWLGVGLAIIWPRPAASAERGS